ncbi:MAG: flagellar assembly protein FliW [Ignavibacteria bacterium]|nr:flagellar assembly protein FliW [Ignavibacteria bacterium]
MKITTKQFGEIEVDEKLIINFKEGILGFENLKKYVLLTEENGIFFWLTSLETPEIVFPLFPLRVLDKDYPQEKNAEAFGIVKLDKEPSKININLKAPVYINQEEKIGFQKVIDNEKFIINYTLFVEN